METSLNTYCALGEEKKLANEWSSNFKSNTISLLRMLQRSAEREDKKQHQKQNTKHLAVKRTLSASCFDEYVFISGSSWKKRRPELRWKLEATAKYLCLMVKTFNTFPKGLLRRKLFENMEEKCMSNAMVITWSNQHFG